jgi:hypothetical protein
MVGDPNWLFSTIAQSSAAIVAIVGGFITASVLMLLSEKRSIANQLKDRQARLDGLVSRGAGGLFGMERKDDSESFREDEISSLEREVKSLEARIKAFGYPPNLGWGIGVLGYLAVFGILLPVLIIVCEAFFTWAKIFTTVSFWLGIMGVFAFIIFQIRTLRR